MSATTKARPALPVVEGLRILSGEGGRWPDGWLTGTMRLRCRALTGLAALELEGWNPDWAAIYAGNVVTLAAAGRCVSTQPLAMGESFRLQLALEVPAGQTFDVLVASVACRSPDPMEGRERSIILKTLLARSAV